jgi:hypothetical protein
MGDDMTITDFVENKWFKLLTRGAMIVVMGVSGYIGVRLALYDSRIASVETKVAGVEEAVSDVIDTQGERATINDGFQQSVGDDFDTLTNKVTAVQLDVARIVGIVTEMQRRDVAERFIPDR